ncbi:hypothetical protein C7212DRAFT_183682 [Tuber magnatum]|uniref:25S rRNA (uridine-N(3))-methyltransferase BMT5-like domain-containing protein n=1 Tax=Tuber magnatum TaxID=42249 RepID=A0A317SUU5_9PEZI|nr:hypothetical protein C7212DRAFT_183682 [Tuber magnatum]
MPNKRKHTCKPSSSPFTKHPHPRKKQKATPQPHCHQQKSNSKSKSKPIAKQPPQTQRPPTLFCPSSRILLLGEGDFSFAASLVRHHHVRHLTATSLDSEAELLEKYPQAAGNVAVVRGMVGGGGVVVHGVDARAVGKVKAVRKRRGEVVHGPAEDGEGEDGEEGRKEQGEGGAVGFDVIAFMFPHIGGKSTHLDRQVRGNQRTVPPPPLFIIQLIIPPELLQSFFISVKPLLSPRGVIVATLFEGEQYDLWNIKGLAKAVGFQTRTSFKFAHGDYPGYAHARTVGNITGGGWKGEERDARTFVFEVGDSGRDTVGGSKQGKRNKRDDSSDGD